MPVVGSTIVSMNPPKDPNVTAEPSAAPFGLRIEIRIEQQAGPTSRLIRSPAVPLKVSLAFCPGTVVSAVAGGPPTTIEEVVSAGTS